MPDSADETSQHAFWMNEALRSDTISKQTIRAPTSERRL